MDLAPHQQALLDRFPELDTRDLPVTWWGNADLDAQIEANKRKRLAAERPKPPKPSTTTRAPFDPTRFNRDLTNLLAEILAPIMLRLDELEARPVLSPRGTWKAGTAYSSGDCVQHQGGLWMCTAPTEGARPNASPHWKLVVKRGAFRDEDAK